MMKTTKIKTINEKVSRMLMGAVRDLAHEYEAQIRDGSISFESAMREWKHRGPHAMEQLA